MNVARTQAFFHAFGWVVDSSSERAGERWLLSKEIAPGVISMRGFASLKNLWLFWRSYTERLAFENPALEILAAKYIAGDCKAKSSIMAWVLDEQLSISEISIPGHDISKEVKDIERSARKNLRLWRSYSAKKAGTSAWQGSRYYRFSFYLGLVRGHLRIF